MHIYIYILIYIHIYIYIHTHTYIYINHLPPPPPPLRCNAARGDSSDERGESEMGSLAVSAEGSGAVRSAAGGSCVARSKQPWSACVGRRRRRRGGWEAGKGVPVWEGVPGWEGAPVWGGPPVWERREASIERRQAPAVPSDWERADVVV